MTRSLCNGKWLVAGLALIVGSPPVHAQYEVTFEILLRSDDAISFNGPVHMNDHGDITGMAYLVSPGYPEVIYRLLEGGELEFLTKPDEYTHIQTPRINNQRQVSFTGALDHMSPFRYTDGIGIEDLGTMGLDRDHALDINDIGQVVGQSWGGSAGGATRYTDGIGLEYIGSLGGSPSIAWGINNRGWIAGASELEDGIQHHAFLYIPEDGMMDLGTFGGRSSVGKGINNRGDVFGWSTDETERSWQFLYTAEDGMQKIDSGDAYPSYNEINDSRWLIGLTSFDEVLWTPEAGLIYLQDFVPRGPRRARIRIDSAEAINNRGQILGQGSVDRNTLIYRMTFRRLPSPASIR